MALVRKKHLNPFKQMFRHKPFVKLEPQKRNYEISINSIFLRNMSCLHHFPNDKVAGLSIQCIKCIAFLFTSRKESIHLKLWGAPFVGGLLVLMWLIPQKKQIHKDCRIQIDYYEYYNIMTMIRTED